MAVLKGQEGANVDCSIRLGSIVKDPSTDQICLKEVFPKAIRLLFCSNSTVGFPALTRTFSTPVSPKFQITFVNK